MSARPQLIRFEPAVVTRKLEGQRKVAVMPKQVKPVVILRRAA